jgi:hypothetical protein
VGAPRARWSFHPYVILPKLPRPFLDASCGVAQPQGSSSHLGSPRLAAAAAAALGRALDTEEEQQEDDKLAGAAFQARTRRRTLRGRFAAHHACTSDAWSNLRRTWCNAF